MNKEDEMILCIPDQQLDGAINPEKVYLPLEDAGLFRRGDAETDTTKRQIIPYIIVTRKNGDILTYKRGAKGGEERLHDLYTFGVGGHINSKDYPCGIPSVEDAAAKAIVNCIEREIKEELAISISDFEAPPQIIAVISLNNSEVDKVHLGIAFKAVIKEESIELIKPEEGAFEETSFKTIEEIESLRLEDWSRTLIPVLKQP
jgi:predicted NUDIX family phosphoesterase